MAKISVIVPIYGVEKYLRECLDSIINQTFKDLEIILIDDGGKDSCPRIIDEYAKNDTRIIPVHKPNGGYGQTCNVGLDKATGEYISIIEPDDYIDLNMYSDLYKLASENDLDLIKTPYFQNYVGNETPKSLMVMPNHEEFIKPIGIFTLKDNPTFMHIHPSIWSCLYKREFLNKNNIRFIEAPGSGWTDNPFQVQTFCLAKRIMYYDKPYYYWRVTTWDDLKDYKIPFLRTKEIHSWLNENKISNIGILSYLCKREITYLKMTNKIIKFAEMSDYKRLYREYFDMISPIFKGNKVLNFQNKKFLYLMRYFMEIVVIHTKLKNFRRKIISLQFNKNHKYLTIFDKCLLGERYN